MAGNKTRPNAHSVARLLKGLDDSQQQTDSRQLLKLMQAFTQAKPRMWGPASSVSAACITAMLAGARATPA